MEKKRVMFLFGAGAEICLGMPQGYEYLRDSLFGKENKGEILDALGERFDGQEFFGGYKYSRHSYSNATVILKNLIRAKITNDNVWLVEWKEIIAQILNNDDLEDLCEDKAIASIVDKEKIEHIKFNCKERIDIEGELKDVLSQKKKYKRITSPFLQSLFEQGNDGNAVVDLNVGLSGMLDEYFHTIISPQKYGKNKYAKIFNYYWMCYFCLVEAIVKNANDKTFSDFVTENRLDYRRVLNDFEGFSRALYDWKLSNCKKDNYYSILKDEFSGSDFYITSVATTNYYKYCELIDAGEYLYLNGKLNLIELPEVLEVRDASLEKINETQMFFPFIFGQSLVKPIVHKVQIETYHRFAKRLKESDCLVVFGYNINEDDNHINSIVHEAINEGLRIIVVGDKEENVGRKENARKLRCSGEQIWYCSVKYGNNSQVIQNIVYFMNTKFGATKND